MVEIDSTLNNLRKIYLRNLIGGRARYQGTVYEIIEVLDDGPSLVLQDCENHTTIQADQHGEAHRRVPPTLTLTIPATEDGRTDLEAIGLELLDTPTEQANSLVG